VEDRGPERVLQGCESLAEVLASLETLGDRTRDIFILFRLENMKQLFEPKYAPRFMTVFEIEVDSEEQARSSAELLARFDAKERASHGYLEREATLYTEIKDVRR